jgi:hypothetical protein
MRWKFGTTRHQVTQTSNYTVDTVLPACDRQMAENKNRS